MFFYYYYFFYTPLRLSTRDFFSHAHIQFFNYTRCFVDLLLNRTIYYYVRPPPRHVGPVTGVGKPYFTFVVRYDVTAVWFYFYWIHVEFISSNRHLSLCNIHTRYINVQNNSIYIYNQVGGKIRCDAQSMFQLVPIII